MEADRGRECRGEQPTHHLHYSGPAQGVRLTLGPYSETIDFCEPVFLNVYGAQELIPRNKFRQHMEPEPVFLNVHGAQESIPRNKFRQHM